MRTIRSRNNSFYFIHQLFSMQSSQLTPSYRKQSCKISNQDSRLAGYSSSLERKQGCTSNSIRGVRTAPHTERPATGISVSTVSSQVSHKARHGTFPGDSRSGNRDVERTGLSRRISLPVITVNDSSTRQLQESMTFDSECLRKQ